MIASIITLQLYAVLVAALVVLVWQSIQAVKSKHPQMLVRYISDLPSEKRQKKHSQRHQVKNCAMVMAFAQSVLQRT